MIKQQRCIGYQTDKHGSIIGTVFETIHDDGSIWYCVNRHTTMIRPDGTRMSVTDIGEETVHQPYINLNADGTPAAE